MVTCFLLLVVRTIVSLRRALGLGLGLGLVGHFDSRWRHLDSLRKLDIGLRLGLGLGIVSLNLN